MNKIKYLPIDVDFLLATAKETTSNPPVDEQLLKAITVDIPVQMPPNIARGKKFGMIVSWAVSTPSTYTASLTVIDKSNLVVIVSGII